MITLEGNCCKDCKVFTDNIEDEALKMIYSLLSSPMFKGAIRSYKGEKMIIPFNMRDGLAICEGKSNEDWNCTAPHGSGRSLSRSKAKKDIKLDDFIEEMKGIYSTSVCKNTLDESPDAYKPTDEIIENIKDTCNILFLMKPKINIKDTSEPTEFWKK